MATESTVSSRKQSLVACIMCCHIIDNSSRYDTAGVCGHKGVCTICSLRMRELLQNITCTMCKTELHRVISLQNESDTYDNYQDWGENNIGPSHIYDERSKMFLIKRQFADIQKLREPFCPKCNKKFSNIAALKSHVSAVHQLQYCNVCLEYKHAFLGELELYTKDQLRQHNIKGKKGEGFNGHPRCDFCFSRFYTTNELYEHLHKNHHECDICLRSLGIENRYYKNYADLENHFRAEHFLCEEPMCLANKFVAFKSHLDYQAHMRSVHPHIPISNRVEVHFNIKRAFRDGSGGNGLEDVETGFEYLNLQNNSQRDEANTINVADFPSLAGTPQPTSGQLHWESQSLTGPRMEDFPALTSNGSSGGHATSYGFRNAIAPPPTPAMLAHMGLDPQRSAAAAVFGANNPVMRLVKPGKVRKKGKTGKSKTPSMNLPQQNEEEEKLPYVEDGESNSIKDSETQDNESKTAIVLRIRQILGSDEKYEQMREECRLYRDGEKDVDTFYRKVRSMFESEEHFDTLFVSLMKKTPDRNIGDQFMKHHRMVKTGKGSKQTASIKKQSKESTKQHTQSNRAPAKSGWAQALKESGVTSVSPQASRHIARNSTKQPASGPKPTTATWSSSNTWGAASNGSTDADNYPGLPKSVTAAPAPIEPVRQPPPARTPTQPSTFKMAKDDFPGLPKAGKAVGITHVTRATWDEELQAIAKNRSEQIKNGGGKKKKKPQKMTLGDMAMKFA